MKPIIVDCFAGGGGASMGIELALGRPIDEAINHDPEAIAMHEANHPRTRHWTQDVWEVDPATVCAGRPVSLAWFSPDCKHFSKAKGGKPRNKNIRSLAWVVTQWAEAVRPNVIMLENVEEFQQWGPLDEEGLPIRERRGETFFEWVSSLQTLGYEVDWRELRACDYGAPTIRKRLFIIARCDGYPINWPFPSHAKGSPDLLPYRTAAECIDWSLPCPSIFLTKDEGRKAGVHRPLAEATMRRIATGIRRFVIETANPFIVSMTHQGGDRTYGLDQPVNTITGAHRGEYALVTPFVARTAYKNANGSYVNSPEEPFRTLTAQTDGISLVAPALVQIGWGERDGQTPRALDPGNPLGTIPAGGVKFGAVCAFLAKHFGGVVGVPATGPAPTVLSKAAQTTIITSNLVKLWGTSGAQGIDEPVPTVTAGGGHIAEVRAFLLGYYGSEKDGQPLSEPMRTLLSRDRYALITVHGDPYVIVDIGMRMLTPRELFRAQGFPEGYIIDPSINGRPLTKTAQVRMVGNSVCPDVARALVESNVTAVYQRELWKGY